MSLHVKLLVAAGAVLAGASCTPATVVNETTALPETASPAVTVPADDEDIEATIAQLEREWVAAIVKKDGAALDRLLAEEFAGISPTAHYYDKTMAIDDLKRGTYVVESMNLDEVSVNAYGDMAVAFASQEEKSRYADVDISGHYHYTNVWANKDGRWQAVASHGTRFDRGHQ
jgi:ketosteroid isomerase-like protein